MAGIMSSDYYETLAGVLTWQDDGLVFRRVKYNGYTICWHITRTSNVAHDDDNKAHYALYKPEHFTKWTNVDGIEPMQEVTDCLKEIDKMMGT